MHRNALACTALLWFASCDADDPCDKAQIYKQGSCMPKPAANDASTQDSASADMADATSCAEIQSEVLGRPCNDATSCNCAAPYCAKMPGQPTGTCTLFCRTMPDDCPESYRCFDLSLLGVTGIEPFCSPK